MLKYIPLALASASLLSLAAQAVPVDQTKASTATRINTPGVYQIRSSESDFALVESGIPATVIHSSEDAEVVHIAAKLFAEDIERVTSLRPSLKHTTANTKHPLVLIGTLGKSPIIDALAANGQIDVSGIEGGWEQYRIEVIDQPSPDVPQALIIAGSDPRGTAFGVFELSRAMGVSPWYWWADVPSRKAVELYVDATPHTSREPAVRYRGIFLNDEGWGLRPWAAKTYEPEANNIGPKTYARIFELMLRLRANSIWPAMHPGTTPFHQMPGNPEVADAYAIVLGSSHAEPMLRNNVGEWKEPKEHYNFFTHPELVLDYWEQRVMERTSGESLFTLGMRGIHDSHMQGSGNQTQRIAALERLFAEQRELLARHLGDGDPTKVSQIFVPYKEVLADYDAGLTVPDDVTIVWPDDNYGYIRRFPSEAEAARSGGTGVYYHVSYLGRPMSYLWIDNPQVTLTWAEMTRAYEQGAREFWVVNVGDLKNSERSTEYFLDLAWRADDTTPDDSMEFLRRSAARDFGQHEADAILDISRRLQALTVERKTDHLQWHLVGKPYAPTELNDREIAERLDACAQLLADSEALWSRLPSDARDAYYQLVHYPLAITTAANDHYFSAELARLQKARGEVAQAESTFARVKPAMDRMRALTDDYNNTVADGKWKHIVQHNGIPYTNWFVHYMPHPDVPALDSDAQNMVAAAPAAPEPGPLPRPDGARPGDFVERGGVVSIHAGHFTDQQALPCGAGWRSVPGLGRTGFAVTVLPSTAAITPEATPSLDYRFHVATGGTPTIHVRLLPTFPLPTSDALKLALSIDEGTPLQLALADGFNTTSDAWYHRVLENAASISIELDEPLAPGWHTLRLSAVDAGVVVDKIEIEFEEQPRSYNGPAETRLQ